MNSRSDENLFYSTTDIDDQWKEAKPLGGGLNTSNHEGMSTLVKNGRTAFYTACERSKVKGPCDIWVADVKGNKMVNGQPLEGILNSEAWESQASISCDGNGQDWRL